MKMTNLAMIAWLVIHSSDLGGKIRGVVAIEYGSVTECILAISKAVIAPNSTTGSHEKPYCVTEEPAWFLKRKE